MSQTTGLTSDPKILTKNGSFALGGSPRMPSCCHIPSLIGKTLNTCLISPSCNQVGENQLSVDHHRVYLFFIAT